MKIYHLYVCAPNSVNAAIFVFDDHDQCTDVKLQFMTAHYVCWIKEVDAEDSEETTFS